MSSFIFNLNRYRRSCLSLGKSFLLFFLLSQTVMSCQHFKNMLGIGALPPKVQLDGVELTDFNSKQVKVNATFTVFNPNDFKVVFKDLVYDFRLGNQQGKLVAQGEKKQEIQIASQQSRQIVVPIRLNASEIFSLALTQLYQKRKVALYYQVRGLFDGPLGFMSIHRDGTMKLKI